MPSDVQIVQAAQKGDKQAFETLVEKYKNAVYAVIFPKVRNYHQAEDLAQETFVQAYKNLSSMKEPEKVGFWLCGIARNITRKWITRKKRNDFSIDQLMAETPWLEDEMLPLPHQTSEETPLENIQQAQMRQLLWRCLMSLPEISKEILFLFYMREMRQQDIARFLNISLTAVRNRLSDARKRLKRRMIDMVENTIQSQSLSENFTEQVIAEVMAHGEKYLADGRWEKAREQFQRATDIQQDYAPAYRGMGMAVKGMIDDQLNLPQGIVERQLLEEAYTELERAYRLGARDSETVWTLANLYHLFQRCEEYVELLWDFAQTGSDIKASFEAGYECLFEIQQNCVADFQRAVNSHQMLLEKFAAQVSPANQLDSYLHVGRAYFEVERAEDWLMQTEYLAKQTGDKMLMAQCFFYMQARGVMFEKLKRYQEAARTYEMFIDWVRASEDLHPHKQRFIIEIQGEHLLPTYHELGERETIKAVLADAEATLQAYHVERDTLLASITDESEVTRERFDAMYGRVETYPQGDSVETIQNWVTKKYFTGILYATHNLAVGCARIGEGEAAIRLFQCVAEHEQQHKGHVGANVYTWLASLVLRFRNDRHASLKYLKRAAEDRRWAASGWIKRTFEQEVFDSVRTDPAFLAVVNESVISD